jgi:hypothetical protein
MTDNATKRGTSEGKPEEAATNTAATAPNSVAGQRHVAPESRHSQQKHRLAAERAAKLGLTTVRELYDHDRAAVLAKLQKTADGKSAQQRNEQSRRIGVSTGTTETP